MKSPLKVLILLLPLAFAYSECRADYIDLRGSEVLNQGQCKHTDGRVYLCVALSNGGKFYNVLLDEKGEVAIYLINEGKATLIWARNSV